MSNIEDDISDKMMSHLDNEIDAYNHLAEIEIDDIHKSSLQFTAGEFEGLKKEFLNIMLEGTISKTKKLGLNNVRKT